MNLVKTVKTCENHVKATIVHLVALFFNCHWDGAALKMMTNSKRGKEE